MHPTLVKMLAHGPLLTDGAWGTQLQARGLAPGDFPDAWNLTHPEKVAEVAAAYVNAGSQVILTNTFGSNRIRLLENEALVPLAADMNREGVRISRAAAAGRAYVFASLGPSGKMIMSDEVTPDELTAAFTEQAFAMAEAGADAIVIETMSDPAEAVLAIQAAKPTGLPIVACMVFDSGKNKDRTMMGTTPEQAAQILAEAGADVIGANCGQGIEAFVPLCQRLRAATQLPLWIKPNAGLPEFVDGRMVYRVSPEAFAAQAAQVLAAGASFLGGCCGSSPDFIRALHTMMQARA
jgi:methionine synthase I (cobalamin-dependent)